MAKQWYNVQWSQAAGPYIARYEVTRVVASDMSCIWGMCSGHKHIPQQYPILTTRIAKVKL